MYNRHRSNQTLRAFTAQRRRSTATDEDLPRGWLTFNIETGEARPAVSCQHAIACCCKVAKVTGKMKLHPIYYGDGMWCDVDILSRAELAGIPEPPKQFARRQVLV